MNRTHTAQASVQQDDKERAEPIWQLIPLIDFRSPASAAPEAVRSGLSELWKRLRGRAHTEEEEHWETPSLEAPSQELLDWAAPVPVCAVDELAEPDSALRTWLDHAPEKAGLLSLVDSPVANLGGDFSAWAAAQGFTVLQPPTPAQILEGDTDWLDALPLDSQSRLLLPNLESCFLRHHNGLALVRGLFDRVDRERPALLVICQSWAWRYLSRVAQIDALCGMPLTLAPFDGQRLNRWLSKSAGQSNPFDFVFREARTGKAVLDKSVQGGKADSNPSPFLRHLAAASRGNPHVAWHIWRRCLLTARDERVDSAAIEAADDDLGFTIWVRPWEEIALPDLTGRTSKEEAMLLHTVLLHGALTLDQAAALLPLSAAHVRQCLHHLGAEGVMRSADGLWSLIPAGYPAVRRLLIDEGYLSDNL